MFLYPLLLYTLNIPITPLFHLDCYNSHLALHLLTQCSASFPFSSVQFSRSVVSDSLQPMNHSTTGLPVHHQLPEFTQTHVHRVSDAIQPSHPLSSSSSPCLQSFPASGSFLMSQLFTSGGQSTGVSASASVFPKNTQD